jgi:predicted transglutaminase-like cysteine proteinase
MIEASIRIAKFLSVTLIACVCASMSIASVDAMPIAREPAFTAMVEKAEPPPGWYSFCERYKSECVGEESSPKKIELTDDNWGAIVGANKWVNKNIKPMTDRRHWHTINKWAYPDDGYGDCKDYVLLKRRILMEGGFPRSALLITIVWTKQNKGHAVLIVRTDKGDYVLDNLTSKVLLWTDTTHDYVYRQSTHSPNSWVYIDGYRENKREESVASRDN